MINFLAEVSVKDRESYIYPTPLYLNKTSNIYEIDISEPLKILSYWIDWGGYYDNYVGTNIVLYFSEFLKTVTTIHELLITENSMFFEETEKYLFDCGDANNNSVDIFDSNETILDCLDASNNAMPIDINNTGEFGEEIDLGDVNGVISTIKNELDGGTAYEEYSNIFNKKVLINLPRHPWLYENTSVSTRRVIPFISYPLDPDNPSNLYIRNEQGYPLLEVPNFSVKLSDNINGVSLNQGFNIGLINNDGFFDDEINWNLFNSPISIKKSIKDKSVYEDFNEIRSGYVDDVITNFDSIQVSVSDKLRSMNEPVCKTINKDDFNFYVDNNAVDKFIPIVYGVKNVPLIKLDNNTRYLAAEHVSQLIDVYDRDGNIIMGNIDSNMVITSTTNASSARIIGYQNNKIGEIIKDLVVEKSGIPYGVTYWNQAEVNKYIQISPQINILITGGDVKKAIQDVLRSDMAYFMQQQDGRFTIRKYGEKYNEHYLLPWMLTKKPEKVYSNAMENYFSSCIINYLNQINDSTLNYLYNDLEDDAEFTYNKKVNKVFETDLYNFNAVRALAESLGYRYTTMRQSIRIGLGVDTSGMELLDTVNLNFNINDRKFSNATKFIIKEINPAQDILVLEEI